MKKISLIVLLLYLFFVQLVSATWVEVPQGVTIRGFVESIEIKENSVIITNLFDVIIPYNQTNEIVSIVITPPYTSNDNKNLQYFLRICGGSHSRETNLEQNRFGIECSELVIENKTINKIFRMNNAPIFIKLTPEDLMQTRDIGNVGDRAVYIHLKYKLNNFIKDKGYKTALIDKIHCQTNEAKPCLSQTPLIYLIVPNNAIIEGQENLEVWNYMEEDNRLIFEVEDAESNSLFLYRDTVKEFKDKGLWIIIGVFLALLSSLMFLFVEDSLKNVNKLLKGLPLIVFSIILLSFLLFLSNPSTTNRNLLLGSLIIMGILWVILFVVTIVGVYQNRREIIKKMLPYLKWIKLKKHQILSKKATNSRLKLLRKGR